MSNMRPNQCFSTHVPSEFLENALNYCQQLVVTASSRGSKPWKGLKTLHWQVVTNELFFQFNREVMIDLDSGSQTYLVRESLKISLAQNIDLYLDWRTTWANWSMSSWRGHNQDACRLLCLPYGLGVWAESDRSNESSSSRSVDPKIRWSLGLFPIIFDWWPDFGWRSKLTGPRWRLRTRREKLWNSFLFCFWNCFWFLMNKNDNFLRRFWEQNAINSGEM